MCLMTEIHGKLKGFLERWILPTQRDWYVFGATLVRESKGITWEKEWVGGGLTYGTWHLQLLSQ